MDASIIISIIALTVSLIVGVAQVVLQRRITRIEEARHASELESKRKAEVTARIESFSTGQTGQAKAYRFVLENLGPAPAQGVSFEIAPPASGEAPFVQTEGHNFPLVLDPHQDYKMACFVVMGTAPSVAVDLAWRDGTGPRTKTLTLTIH
jgi:hypothetical protein